MISTASTINQNQDDAELMNRQHREFISLSEDLMMSTAADLQDNAYLLGFTRGQSIQHSDKPVAAVIGRTWGVRVELTGHGYLSKLKSGTQLYPEPSATLSEAEKDVLTERHKQESKGYTSEQDDYYSSGELAEYGVVHALLATGTQEEWPHLQSICSWPIKKNEPRRMLVKAAALLLAEIERLDRAQAKVAHNG